MASILVVEDDSDLRYLYGTVLERRGHQVAVASNTGEAIQVLNDQTVDLMILDISMPDGPGTKLITFAQNDKRLEHIQIVVISANDRWEDHVRSFGIEHFMVKPITNTRLAALVEQMLKS
ncbi:MAG: response regulator [Chloroflexi bacterium]|nr:response regulator [Chloroflexota bacterium]